jgi:hypothetical protein
MNLILLLVLISELCIGICTWLSPEALRRFAAHLLTRADVIEVSREEAARRMRFWSKELHLNRSAREEGSGALGPVKSAPSTIAWRIE